MATTPLWGTGSNRECDAVPDLAHPHVWLGFKHPLHHQTTSPSPVAEAALRPRFLKRQCDRTLGGEDAQGAQGLPSPPARQDAPARPPQAHPPVGSQRRSCAAIRISSVGATRGSAELRCRVKNWFPAPRAAACLVHYLVVQKVTSTRFTILNGLRRRIDEDFPGIWTASKLVAVVTIILYLSHAFACLWYFFGTSSQVLGHGW
jgi:hypothetical protein